MQSIKDLFRKLFGLLHNTTENGREKAHGDSHNSTLSHPGSPLGASSLLFICPRISVLSTTPALSSPVDLRVRRSSHVSPPPQSSHRHPSYRRTIVRPIRTPQLELGSNSWTVVLSRTRRVGNRNRGPRVPTRHNIPSQTSSTTLPSGTMVRKKRTNNKTDENKTLPYVIRQVQSSTPIKVRTHPGPLLRAEDGGTRALRRFSRV